MRLNERLLLLSLFSLAALPACHGGGSSTSAGSSLGAVPALSSLRQSTTGTASFSVALAPAGPLTQSLVVRLVQVNGGIPPAAVAPVKINLAPQMPGCTTAGGATKCTASIAVPAGSDTFSVVTYSMPNGAGAVVSTTQTTTNISPAGKTWCTPAEAHAAAAAAPAATTGTAATARI